MIATLETDWLEQRRATLAKKKAKICNLVNGSVLCKTEKAPRDRRTAL
jgi:hypothetical protein